MPKIDTNDRKNLENQFNIPKNSTIIGCAGRFSKQKGFDLLPQIISKLPKNTYIIHAGGQGNDEKKNKKPRTKFPL